MSEAGEVAEVVAGSRRGIAPAAAGGADDVGTPFLRRHGHQAMDPEIVLSTAPAPMRPLFRRLGTVHSCFDDHCDIRTAAVDRLGSYHEEGRPDRIEAGLNIVDDWLCDHDAGSITRAEVDRHCRSGALLRGFWLSARRVDRAVRRLAGTDYDFVRRDGLDAERR